MDLTLNAFFQWGCIFRISITLIASCTIPVAETICSTSVKHSDQDISTAQREQNSRSPISSRQPSQLNKEKCDIHPMREMSQEECMNQQCFQDCLVFSSVIHNTLIEGIIASYRKVSHFFKWKLCLTQVYIHNSLFEMCGTRRTQGLSGFFFILCYIM